MSIKCYYFYGPSGTGKTLTAKLMSKYYGSRYKIPFQPFIKSKNSFNFKGYRGEEVILLDNDLYKGREYAIFLMIINWYQVLELWESPKCIVICSLQKPTNTMMKILRETHSIIYEFKYNNLNNILDDIKEKIPELEENVEMMRKERMEGSITESDSELKENEEKKPKKKRISKQKKNTFKGNILDYIKTKSTSKD